MNILITGAKGQLGMEIRKREGNYPMWNFVYVDLAELDITNKQQVIRIIQQQEIHVIVNCAAYTAVDKAENEKEMAQAVNVSGALILAQLASQRDLLFIHISTDFVFDGKHYLPYVEADKPNPMSVYGQTKRNGEEAVLNEYSSAIILRTSWLYSVHGNNFVKTMQRLGRERQELRIIFDQLGTPTWAGDLADTILKIITDPESGKTKKGIYHYSNEGVASWYDFAIEVMIQSNISCRVSPIETREYPTAAKRPYYSVLNKAKIKTDFKLTIPHWKEALHKCIEELELNLKHN